MVLGESMPTKSALTRTKTRRRTLRGAKLVADPFVCHRCGSELCDPWGTLNRSASMVEESMFKIDG